MVQLKSALCLLPLLATSAVAFTVPLGQPEGTYVVFVNETGQEEHVPIANYGIEHIARVEALESRKPVEEFDAAPSRIQKRFQTWCGCGQNMNHAATDAAVQDLKDHTALIGPGASAYNYKGTNTVAFVCNHCASGSARASVKNIADAAGAITNKCGWYVAGTNSGVSNNCFTIGYMNHVPNVDVWWCSRDRSGTTNAC
ncbi:hypothetical protein DL98DRAFT_512221 [Cadophora sp. DSE1049]|nr:hypothetical protein DL98DRAFT_512221 [Cadophora sp. DSE1049]